MAVESTSGASGVMTTIYEGVKNAVIWCGRKIASGFTNYLVPGISALFAFLRTGFGLASLGFGVGSLLLGIASLKRLENYKWTRFVLNVIAAACFVGAGAALLSGTAVLI